MEPDDTTRRPAAGQRPGDQGRWPRRRDPLTPTQRAHMAEIDAYLEARHRHMTPNSDARKESAVDAADVERKVRHGAYLLVGLNARICQRCDIRLSQWVEPVPVQEACTLQYLLEELEFTLSDQGQVIVHDVDAHEEYDDFATEITIREAGNRRPGEQALGTQASDAE
jgi:hypothetical protein